MFLFFSVCPFFFPLTTMQKNDLLFLFLFFSFWEKKTSETGRLQKKKTIPLPLLIFFHAFPPPALDAAAASATPGNRYAATSLSEMTACTLLVAGSTTNTRRTPGDDDAVADAA